MLVRDAMTKRVEMLGPHQTLVEAARRMRDLGVGALPVCEEGSAMGFITDRKIIEHASAPERPVLRGGWPWWEAPAR